MDFSKELIVVTRPMILEKGNYGHWKVKMRASIRGIGSDAWISVSNGWEPPVVVGEDGISVPKPEEQWTESEKRKATANSKALSVIFNSINESQFKRIQNCESAKEAWDKLAKAYEGTTSVKRSRIDLLASKFETLTMSESETIEEFSGKLSAIASESQNLGKRYKDKKLVKKLLRCLPSRFESKKTAMATSLDTDTIEFEEVVGMLQAHEMEIVPPITGKSKGIAFSATEDNKEIENLKAEVELLARNYGKILKKFDKHEKHAFSKNTSGDILTSEKRSSVKCHECQGVGHVKTNCPTVKMRELKCFECGGYGHTKFNCIGSSMKKKSFMVEDDNDSQSSDSDEEVKGFVAFIGSIEDDSSSDESESDSDVEVDAEKEFRKIHEAWLLVVEEKITLTREKLILIDEKDKLIKEIAEEREEHNKLNERLTAEIGTEREKNRSLTQELTDLRKQVLMLNSGTKELDKILSVGRLEKTDFGMGYNEGESSHITKFLKGSTQAAETMVNSVCKNKERHVPANYARFVKNKHHHHTHARRYECFYCGRLGHIKRFCYRYKDRIERLMHQGRVYPHQKMISHGYVRRSELQCFVAFNTEESDDGKPWYFDSGASRHMTGVIENLKEYSKLKESKVIYGDGAKGKIKGKGSMNTKGKPQLKDVYYVKGLTVNLISISQLCDEGFSVIFSKEKCEIVDQYGHVTMQGVRSSNNCYMWEEMSICLQDAKDDSISWRHCLGNMSNQSVSKLVTQSDKEITITQTKFAQNLMKRSSLCSSKSTKSQKSLTLKLLKDDAASGVDKKLYWGMIGNLLDLIMIANYGMILLDPLLVECGSINAIDISRNYLRHSRTKRIDIRHHFMRDLVHDKQDVIEHVSSDAQLSDIFTKPVDSSMSLVMQKSLGVCGL